VAMPGNGLNHRGSMVAEQRRDFVAVGADERANAGFETFADGFASPFCDDKFAGFASEFAAARKGVGWREKSEKKEDREEGGRVFHGTLFSGKLGEVLATAGMG